MKQLVVLGALVACNSEPAKLANKQVDPKSFVSEAGAILTTVGDHAVRMRLDGTIEQALYDTRFSLSDVTRDGTLFIVHDRNLTTYRFRAGDAEPEVLPIGFAALAVLSPDGKTLASVAYHQEYADSDNAVMLLDLDTLAMRTIPADARGDAGYVTGLSWLAADQLLLEGFKSPTLLRIATGERSPTDRSRPMPWYRPAPAGTCGDVTLVDWGDSGYALTRHGGEPQAFIDLYGRKRGFHDYHRSIPDVLFTPSCKSVLFELNQKTWIADVATGVVGELPGSGDLRIWLRR